MTEQPEQPTAPTEQPADDLGELPILSEEDKARLEAEVLRRMAAETVQAEDKPLAAWVGKVEQILRARAENPNPELARQLDEQYPIYDSVAEQQAAVRARAWRNDLVAAQQEALAHWTVDLMETDQHPEILRKYAATVGQKDARVLNLVLAGRVGPGKTSAAIAAGNLAAAAGATVRFVKHTTYLTWLRPDQAPDGVSAPQIKARYRNCDLLILDDLGAGLSVTTEASDFVTKETEDLIGDRLTAGRHTIFTTNLTSDQLAVVLGPRAISRIGARAYAARFEGQDRRKPVTW